jgi:hypothetical protein
MRTTLIAVVLCSLLSVAQAGQSEASETKAAQVSGCDRCQVILNQIHGALLSRCQTAPSLEELRKQPIYLFLSIFDEVSQGGDKAMAESVYSAAIEGMECDDLGAGVKAAQQMATKLMVESRT